MADETAAVSAQQPSPAEPAAAPVSAVRAVRAPSSAAEAGSDEPSSSSAPSSTLATDDVPADSAVSLTPSPSSGAVASETEEPAAPAPDASASVSAPAVVAPATEPSSASSAALAAEARRDPSASVAASISGPSPAFLRTDPAPSLRPSRPNTPNSMADGRSVHSYRSTMTGAGDDLSIAETQSETASLLPTPLPTPAALASVTNLSKTIDEARLRKLLALLPKLQEALPFKPTAPVHNLAVLVKAETRYIIWLKLLASLDARAEDSILPPLDVAFMWMVHLGDTKSYIQDVLRLGGDHMLGWQFPLERLHQLVVELGADWVDADSERIWRRFAPAEPYRFPYPDNMAEATLPFVCPRCSTTCPISAPQYVRVRFGSDTVECVRCQRGGVNIALWSAMLFLNDVRKVAGDASLANFQLKSTQMASNNQLDPALTANLNSFLKAVRFDLQLQSKLRLSANRYWNDVYALLRTSLVDSSLSAEEQALFTSALMNSYGNIVTELSIDLVERAEHWIRFLAMIDTVTTTETWRATATGGDVASSSSSSSGAPADARAWIPGCCDRYFKFLLLQGALCEQYHAKQVKARAKGQPFDDGAGPKMVMPTFDIMVAYQMHLLNPRAYYQYSMAHFHRVVNFHFYSEAAMVKAYTRTRRLWKQRYREEYDPHTNAAYSDLLTRHRWRKLLKLGGKIVMLPLSLVVVSTVMLLGAGSSAGAAATAVAPPSASGAGGRRETEVTGDFTPSTR
ncbi:hypothetical protein H9P43_001135 [Blastocladiella emersonii ATCC 22665]|nr:hypothetical protein H9P43_001135 [Blastocladiella emersonii ATCC 22665]